MERRLAAILAIDVVGYSRMMGEDEAGTLKRLKSLHKELVQPRICGANGRVVKLMGDGLLAEFSSVVEAVGCAVEIQKAIAARETGQACDKRIGVRIGVNLGDIIFEDGDIYGDGVNVAARLEQLAPSGGVCVSGSVFEQIRDKVEHNFEDLGEKSIKNIARPIRVWRWTSEAPQPEAPKETAQTATEALGQSSLAVLPLVNMSDDRALDFLADGLSEDIITMLARLPGFLVIARNSSFAYKGTTPDIRAVGRELGVQYVVEGSLRPVGDNIRVTIQLIEAETSNHLWAKRFDQPLDRIDELQDEITLGIACRIEPELAKAEIERIKRHGERNLDAWALYNQASGLLSLKGWHRETFEEAEALLTAAIELDPNFALAHAYLALIYALGHMFGLSPGVDDGKAQAIAEAETAIGIDNTNASVLGFAGCALSDVGQVERGIGVLERAVETDPSNAQAWVALGTALLREGKARQGVEMLRRGMRISPLDNRLSFWGTNLAYALFRLRQLDEAETEIRLACRRDDKNYMGRVVLALILLQKDRRHEAQAAMRDALRLRPELTCEDVLTLVGRRGVKMLRDTNLLD